MEALWWIFGIIAILTAVCIVTSFVCFRMVFYSKKRTPLGPDEYEIPKGDIYEAFRDEMIGWIKNVRSMPHEDVSVTSFDGLTLRGRYYENKKDAPIEIMFHGYRGDSERDMCGAVERAFAVGRNALIVDQRASGRSDGHVISFGINERRDCLTWIDFAIKKFGDDVRIMITGISMGAATVMMTSGEALPKNVIGALADCGYTSAKDIIKKVIWEMKLPANVFYPFVKLGAKIFGHFDLEETSPIEAMEKCQIPVIFVHGDDDAFVPYDMSVRLHDACVSDKKVLITVNGAGHGLAYPTDKEGYVERLNELNETWSLA